MRRINGFGNDRDTVDVPKLTVITEPVDTRLFHPATTADSDSNYRPVAEDRKRFVFLSVFKWEARKGWELLLAAYWAVFRKIELENGVKPNVVLQIKTYLP